MCARYAPACSLVRLHLQWVVQHPEESPACERIDVRMFWRAAVVMAHWHGMVGTVAVDPWINASLMYQQQLQLDQPLVKRLMPGRQLLKICCWFVAAYCCFRSFPSAGALLLHLKSPIELVSVAEACTTVRVLDRVCRGECMLSTGYGVERCCTACCAYCLPSTMRVANTFRPSHPESHADKSSPD